MSFALIQKVNDKQKKQQVVDARSGDTVRVYQKIREGNKERIQMFEGVVIRTDNKNQHTSRITVRKIASGVGVEKSFLLHSPLMMPRPKPKLSVSKKKLPKLPPRSKLKPKKSKPSSKPSKKPSKKLTSKPLKNFDIKEILAQIARIFDIIENSNEYPCRWLAT